MQAHSGKLFFKVCQSHSKILDADELYSDLNSSVQEDSDFRIKSETEKYNKLS